MNEPAEAARLTEVLAGCPDELCDVLLEVRDFVCTHLPGDADELVRWRSLCYCRGGKAIAGNICGVGWKDDYVEIGFVHGAFLTDDDGILQGEGKSKRHIRVRSMKELPKRAMARLIKQAAKYDPGRLSS